MTFKTQMATDTAVFLNIGEYAASATYTTQAGAASAITAVLSEQADLQAGAPGQSAVATISISRAAVAAPAIYDTVTIDGTTWRVDNVTFGDSAMWTLACSTDHRVQPRNG